MKYYTQRDTARDGWCIFKKESASLSRFVAGAFINKELADSECFRLNEPRPETDLIKGAK